jgi:hypothetical protein
MAALLLASRATTALLAPWYKHKSLKKSVKQSNGHPRCPLQSPTCVASLEQTSSLNFSHFVAQISRACSAILGRVWPHCPTLSPSTASAVRAGVSHRDAAALRELSGNHGDTAGRLKGGSVAITSGKYLLLPGDHIIPNNLTMPEPWETWRQTTVMPTHAAVTYRPRASHQTALTIFDTFHFPLTLCSHFQDGCLLGNGW